MGAKSSIEWTDASWTPLRARRLDTGKVGVHCEKVSPGCKNCYSETFNRRNLPNQGTGLDFTRPNREKVEIFVDERILTEPLRWRRPRRVFVCSQTDLFGEFVADEQIGRVFGALHARHIYQILTKRAERMQRLVSDPEFREFVAAEIAIRLDGIVRPIKWPLPNIWLGVSVEDQERADERIPLLLDAPAAVRFLSVEPMLGPVDLEIIENRNTPEAFVWPALSGEWAPRTPRPHGGATIDWVIVGGESGPGARPTEVAWIRSIVEQCKAAGVACFVKQLGARPVATMPPPWLRAPGGREVVDVKGTMRDRKGGDPAEWPVDLRVREFPEALDAARKGGAL